MARYLRICAAKTATITREGHFNMRRNATQKGGNILAKLNTREVLKTAARIFGYMLAFGFIGFMFVPALMGASAALRVPIIALLIAAAGMLFFMDASYRGERDSAMSETLDKLARADSGYKPSAQEEGRRYSRVKGILEPMLGALPLVVVALLVAFMTEPYVYTLQDLPGWISPYMHRPEIGDALAYMQGALPSASAVDYLRIFVRFMLFPYVGLLGTMTDEMSLLFDRLSPLIALILPLVAAIGYQFGPRRRAKSVKTIEQAKNTPRKRLKKDRRKPNGPQEKKQLV